MRLLAAAERDGFLRAASRALVAGEVDARRPVFVDEMGASGRSTRGAAVRSSTYPTPQTIAPSRKRSRR